MLELNKTVKMILEILSKKTEKHDIEFDAIASEEFLYPPGYQFPPEATPPRMNDQLPLEIESMLIVHEV